MGVAKAKGAVITIDGTSPGRIKSHGYPRSVSVTNIAGYGTTASTYDPTTTDGTFRISGVYDSDDVTGARALMAHLAVTPDTVEITYSPEGLGAGKSTDTFDAILTSYEESGEWAGHVMYSATFQISGTVVETAQGS